MSQRTEQIRYSAAFKRKVVEEIEKGKMTVSQARQLYGIGGKCTVQKWLRQHGRQHLLQPVVRVQMKDETTELQKAKQRIGQLEKALADLQIDQICTVASLEVLQEVSGIDVKKNIELLPSSERETVLRVLERHGALKRSTGTSG